MERCFKMRRMIFYSECIQLNIQTPAGILLPLKLALSLSKERIKKARRKVIFCVFVLRV